MAAPAWPTCGMLAFDFFEKFESEPFTLNLQRYQKLFTSAKNTRSTKHQNLTVLANIGIMVNETESPTNPYLMCYIYSL